MRPDTDRLQTLLQIAQEYRLSFDDLDDWTQNLDWEEFKDLSRIFMRTKRSRTQNFPFLLEEETEQPYVDFANAYAERTDKF